ncbi:MAG TPA: hypothetical protein VMI35_13950, partial [Puia sp.]|nr:hypothetical protein [Puia sp.]
KKAYTMNISASVSKPAVRKKSANFWWVIFCHAPKITTAAPTQTITLTSFSVDFETPAIVVSLNLFLIGFVRVKENGFPFDF